MSTLLYALLISIKQPNVNLLVAKPLCIVIDKSLRMSTQERDLRKPNILSENTLLFSRYHLTRLLIIECRILHKHDIKAMGLNDDSTFGLRPGFGIGHMRMSRHCVGIKPMEKTVI